MITWRIITTTLHKHTACECMTVHAHMHTHWDYKFNTEVAIAMDTLHHGNSRKVPVIVKQNDLAFHLCACMCLLSDKQRAELTQQHTEWSRQMTQRHMQQIEDLQAQLQAHTQMMALQQVPSDWALEMMPLSFSLSLLPIFRFHTIHANPLSSLNIKNTCLLFLLFYWSSSKSSDLSGHRLRTYDGVVWHLPPQALAVNTLSLVGMRVRPVSHPLFEHLPWMLDSVYLNCSNV